MTHIGRPLAIGLAMTALVSAARPAKALQADETSHVRSSNPSIVALIEVAVTRSSTFRGLIATVNQSDGIVYVESGPCNRGARACLVSITTDGGHRFLQVHVNMHHADWDVMGSIAHELRHTIEVLANPAVTTTESLRYFYQHAEATGGTLTPFETEAAVRAGNAVRAEVRTH
jgi:hypothetical protein